MVFTILPNVSADWASSEHRIGLLIKKDRFSLAEGIEWYEESVDWVKAKDKEGQKAKASILLVSVHSNRLLVRLLVGKWDKTYF